MLPKSARVCVKKACAHVDALNVYLQVGAKYVYGHENVAKACVYIDLNWVRKM